MNLALSSPPYTPTEYLALEENATVKHEYLAGEIIEVAGATANHNLLVGKFHARLLLALEESKSLDSVDFSITLQDLYKRVNLK
ncbi:Uma2 family endonuclease [Spirulina sp. CS-785/01]|uniref:Uma2 family endonuclease n=1 Tax=Spirulina sp. CS-785/01 TaxID=3021716 RepID=UPI00232FBFBD|nr:Uma2 family endonuclease [Spirulina sp. CS-785/01]MDB9314278.1 Uma2 family endonuclease [Spirulina sp. CS-785/01]